MRQLLTTKVFFVKIRARTRTVYMRGMHGSLWKNLVIISNYLLSFCFNFREDLYIGLGDIQI